jgi:hypothetical protein
MLNNRDAADASARHLLPLVRARRRRRRRRRRVGVGVGVGVRHVVVVVVARANVEDDRERVTTDRARGLMNRDRWRILRATDDLCARVNGTV